MPESFDESDLSFLARDGLPLAGTLLAPHATSSPTIPAIVLVHGVAGTRFGPVSEWGRQLAQHGFTTLVIGTRGSEWSWSHGNQRYGATYERIDEAPLDVTGAVDALRSLGQRQFILAGQSLGAVKVVYTQATAPIDGVVGVVPRSGPRFSPDALARPGATFTTALRTATERVAAGEPEALIEAEAPVKGSFAAAAFVEKYSPHGRYDWVALLDRIAVPKLVILGALDPSPLVGAAREALERSDHLPPRCEIRIMPTWAHGFAAPGEDVPAASARLVADWWANVGVAIERDRPGRVR
jgi:dienelactone hydrolase